MPADVPTSRGAPSIRSSRRLSARYFCVSWRFSCTRFEQRFDLDQLARLREIVERPVPQRRDGRVERRLAGQHDGFGIGRQFLRFGDHVDAVEARHVEIDEQAVEGLLLERSGGGEAIGADRHPVPHPRNLELHQLLQRTLVVGKEKRETLRLARSYRI